MKKYCTRCGSAFEALTSRSHVCADCKEKQKIAKKEYLREYVKNRNKRLDVKHTALYAKDHAWIKEQAEKRKVLICDIIHEIVDKCK